MLKPISKLQPFSQEQIRQLGAIPSSLDTINKLKPIQKINQPVNSTGDFVDYNDPNSINSIADVVTRAGKDKTPTGVLYAIGGALDIAADFVPKVEGATIATSTVLNVLGKTIKASALIADKDFREYVKKYYINPALSGNWSAVGYNALQGFSETADLLAQPIKAFSSLAGGSADDGLKNLKATAAGALGINTGYGRKNYDYNTGNFAADMLLELVSDPMNVIDITSGFVKHGAKAAKGVDFISKHAHTARLKNIEEARESVTTIFTNPSEKTTRALKKSQRAAKKAERQSTVHNRYIAKRTRVINRDYDRLKINKRKEFIDKWIRDGKRYYPNDANYQNPGYILNLLETGYLDTAYNAEMQAIERARNIELSKLTGAWQQGISTGQDLGNGWKTVNVYAQQDVVKASDGAQVAVKTPDYLPGGEKITASDAQAITEYRAQGYIELVNNQYDPSKFSKVQAAEAKVNQLNAAPQSIKNTKAWKQGYSRAKAARDKAYTEARINASQLPNANLLSEESVQKLSEISLRPSDNKSLLQGVGGTAVTVIKTANTVQDVANTVDKQVIKTATGYIPSILWRGAKFVGRNVISAARGAFIIHKINKPLKNATANFFNKYTNDEGFLDLSKFNQYYPNYQRFVGRAKLTYSKVPEKDFLITPDASALVKRMSASIDHLDTQVSKTINSNKYATDQLDDLLDVFNKNFRGFFTDAADLAEMDVIRKGTNTSDKLELLKLYRNYIETLSTVDLENLPKSELDSIIKKLRNFEDHINSLKFQQATSHIDEITSKVEFVTKSVKIYTTSSSNLRKNLLNLTHRFSDLLKKYPKNSIMEHYDIYDATNLRLIHNINANLTELRNTVDSWLDYTSIYDAASKAIYEVEPLLDDVLKASNRLKTILLSNKNKPTVQELVNYLTKVRELSNLLESSKVILEGSMSAYTKPLLDEIEQTTKFATHLPNISKTIKKHIDSLNINKVVKLTRETPNGIQTVTTTIADLFLNPGKSMFLKPVFSKIPEGDFKNFKKAYSSVERALANFFSETPSGDLFAAKRWLEITLANTHTDLPNTSKYKIVKTPTDKIYSAEHDPLFSIVRSEAFEIDFDQFSKVYHIIDKFADVKKLSIKDVQSITDMLSDLTTLEEFIELLPVDLPGVSNLANAIANLSKHALSISKVLNVSPDLKAYQVYFSGTKAYFDFITNPDVKAFMNMLRNPSFENKNYLEELLHAFQEADDTTNGAWLRQTELGSFFQEGTEDTVNEALKQMQHAAEDYQRQNVFVEDVFSSSALELSNYAEEDLKRDYLKFLIVDTLNYYYDITGVDFYDNFNEHYEAFLKRLKDNANIRLSESAYNLEYLRSQLKDEYAKAAEQFGTSHSASVDCNINELVVKQWNKQALLDGKEPLFEVDPNAIDIYIDTEFSVTTDLSKGTYNPLQFAYKLANSTETTDKYIKLTPEEADRIDSRTLAFFEKVKKSDMSEEQARNYKYTLADFKKEWCVEDRPDRATVFYDFFKELAETELRTKKHVRLIGHNITGAEIPLLEVEFKRVKEALIKDKIFADFADADTWFNSLKLNSIDTLSQMRLKGGVPAITVEQEEVIRTLLSNYAIASKDASHLTRAINTTIFDGLNSIRTSLKHTSSSAVRSKQTALAFEDFYQAIKDAKTLFSEVLETYKASSLRDYFFDENVFKDWNIEIDGIRILNITQFNAAVGTVSYLGFRRISTPELRHFFNDDIINKSVYNKKYVKLAEQLYEQADRIRYPAHLDEFLPELQQAFNELYTRITTNISLSETPGYKSTLGFFKDLKMPENTVELFVVVRKMYNRYTRFLETRNPELLKNTLPFSSDLTDLLTGADSRLYKNEVVENLTKASKPIYEEVPELERINKLRKRATICCKNETQRLEEVATYLEGVNKTGYDRFIRAKTAHIDLHIRPIAENFSKKPQAYLEQASEVFKKIPQKQLDNRFKNIDATKSVLLRNELLYNPLHTMIIHSNDLTPYKDLAITLKNFGTGIKYKQVGDYVFLYLDNATLQKYTFVEGVPYQNGVKIQRTTFADATENNVSEVLDICKEVTALYELSEDYFSDAGGRTFSEKQLREIYELIPEEIQSELPAIDLLVHSDIFKSGPIINNILLGDNHLRAKIIKSSIEDPITNYVMAAQYCAKDIALRTHWLHYFFDATDGLSIALDEQGNLLDNVLLDNADFSSISDLCAALEVNKTYTLTALIPDGEKLRVFELPIGNPTAIKKIIETRKVPIRLMTKAETQTVKNIIERPTYNFLQKAWNFGLRIFKNAVLLSLGTFLRNVMDTFMKTTIDIGLGNTMHYSFEAHRLRREYNKVIELVTDNSFTLADGSRTSGLLSEKSLDFVFAPGHEALLRNRGITIDRDTFDFIRAFKNSDAAAAMNKHQENQIRYRKRFLESAEYKANPDLTFNEWLSQTNRLKNKLKKGKGLEKIKNGTESLWGTYNGFLSLMITPSSYIEDVNRLAMYLKYSNEGLLTKTSIFQKIKDTHFDFNYKTNITNKIEQFIPFYNFTKENALYWLRILEERPDVLRIISDVMTPILDLDSYNVEELERNQSLVNAITNGYIKIDNETELMLKANPSFMDAFTLFTNPVDAFQQGFIIDTPRSREELTQWEGGWKDIIQQNLYNVPWAGTIAQRVESIKRNQQRLDKQFESTQTPLIRQGLVRAAASVSSTFTVPARYRNAKYTSDQYYRRWRNYRSPVRSIYTKTGISKLTILMEPVSPDNIKYKLGVMQSFVNRQ